MKLIVILLSILYSWVGCSSISAQSGCNTDSLIYLTAYNFIANDSTNRTKVIVVSDSIIDLDRFGFSHGLEKFPMEKVALKQYRATKGFKWFKTYQSPKIKFLVNRKEHEQEVLFFSQIENDILRADLLPIKQQITDIFNYNKLCSFTEGLQYLFIFTKSGNLKLTLTQKVQYD